MALRSGSHPVITSKSKAIRYPRRYVAHAGCRVDRLFFKSGVENVDVINVSREMTSHLPFQLRDGTAAFVSRLYTIAGHDEVA